MKQIQFDLFASYSQLAVFAAGLVDPFNDWEQQHVDQGFAWREGSVSFATLEEAGELHGEAFVADAWHAHPEAARAIQVPFNVTTAAGVEIASISDGVVFKLDALGPCQLVFETWMDRQGSMQARLTFVPRKGAVMPAILKADDALRPPAKLRMTAQPAR